MNIITAQEILQIRFIDNNTVNGNILLHNKYKYEEFFRSYDNE